MVAAGISNQNNKAAASRFLGFLGNLNPEAAGFPPLLGPER
jgi:hypothetical protein